MDIRILNSDLESCHRVTFDNILSPSSIHKNTLNSFNQDVRLDMMSDLQTRLGSKLVNIASAYYENHKKK